ncbi:MAG: hypothetical protein OEV24_13190 [Cyclobacteriaceae bacterium]|nr:hypothetical protein [Cyclobacteriaceae bacterium]MDH5250607.1 hypothetical protein [Cyclobacteriaceae bacterium]
MPIIHDIYHGMLSWLTESQVWVFGNRKYPTADVEVFKDEIESSTPRDFSHQVFLGICMGIRFLILLYVKWGRT